MCYGDERSCSSSILAPRIGFVIAAFAAIGKQTNAAVIVDDGNGPMSLVVAIVNSQLIVGCCTCPEPDFIIVNRIIRIGNHGHLGDKERFAITTEIFDSSSRG